MNPFVLENPRSTTRQRMRQSLSEASWAQNAIFVRELRDTVSSHPVARHPAMQVLSSGTLSLDKMRVIHLEYRHAIVQIFTDALLMAQFQTRQLEPRLSPGSKMDGRALLTLNDLDEFGFVPGTGDAGGYLGNSARAHYPLFERVLDQYGVDQPIRHRFRPSLISTRVREYLEARYPSLVSLSALLAVAEQEVILFSPRLRQATAALGIDVTTGYYHQHGTSDDKCTEAADDDHEDDFWWLTIQAVTEADYDCVRREVVEYCGLWEQFWSYQLARE
ncbi:MAG: hypothetical protein MJE77_05315 [Proteobacteria bacterium]|nr:hypothetical protein [Pseudomonadota bacterium]